VHSIEPRRYRSIGLVTCACLCAILLFSACDKASEVTSPGSPSPSPSPSPPAEGSSAYAGSWTYTTRLMAVDQMCGHSASEIGVPVGPFSVTVNSNGTFSLGSAGGGSGTIDSSGNAQIAIAAGSGQCPSGSGSGGCTSVNHCDGTYVQGGDVHKWVMER